MLQGAQESKWQVGLKDMTATMLLTADEDSVPVEIHNRTTVLSDVGKVFSFMHGPIARCSHSSESI